MCGGYFSFQGIDGRARWRRTAVEEVLPVTCLPYDDRVEMPEGCVADIVEPEPSRARRPGRRLAAAPRRQRGRPRSPAPKSSPACRTTRAAIRCSSSAATARAAPRPGPATSARTGCRRRSVPGTATAGCGRTCSAGSRSGHDPGQFLPRRQRRESASARHRQRRRPRACPQRRSVEPPAPRRRMGERRRQKSVAGPCRIDRPRRLRRNRLRRSAGDQQRPLGALRQHHLARAERTAAPPGPTRRQRQALPRD